MFFHPPFEVRGVHNQSSPLLILVYKSRANPYAAITLLWKVENWFSILLMTYWLVGYIYYIIISWEVSIHEQQLEVGLYSGLKIEKKDYNWFFSVRVHCGPENLKKSSRFKNSWNQINRFYEKKILTKIHFLPF